MIAALAVITVVADVVVVVACHFLPQNRNIFAQQHLNSIQLKLLCVAHFSAFICFSCCASMLHPACLPLNFALCLWRCCTSALSLVFISLRLPLLLAAGWQLCLLVVMLAISVYIFAVVAVVVLQFCFFFSCFCLAIASSVFGAEMPSEHSWHSAPLVLAAHNNNFIASATIGLIA